MAELIVCSLMWALIAVLIIFRRARKERSVLYAAVTIAITMMLNDDDLYFIVDSWFGGRDIVHLISAISLMVGVHFLAQGISRAGAPHWLSGRPARMALYSAIVVTTVAFLLVPHNGQTSESFMYLYGTHAAATVYGSAQYVYLLYVFTALLVTSVRTMMKGSLRREKLAGLLLVLGSACTIALSWTVIGMNVSQLVGGLAASSPWRPAYYVLQVGTFAFLTFGLGIAPIARWVSEHRRHKELLTHLKRVEPMWMRAVAARPGPDLDRPSLNPQELLHRRIVEVRDAAMDRQTSFALANDEQVLLSEAERHLMAGAR